ncbi:unnamed protein product [Clavelina lepadiformis]|uniref:Uncharacterized protein n=1 Tax=Clavelina lepadiformis TaxID=159417 RepID=A0ABP0GED6_CLALP
MRFKSQRKNVAAIPPIDPIFLVNVRNLYFVGFVFVCHRRGVTFVIKRRLLLDNDLAADQHVALPTLDLESGLQVADLPLTHAIVKEEFVTLSFGEITRLMNFLAEVLFRETETQDLDSIPCAISEGMLNCLSFLKTTPMGRPHRVNGSTNSDDVSSNQSISHKPTGSHAFNKVSSSCYSIPPYQLVPYPGGLGSEFPFSGVEKEFRNTVTKNNLQASQFLYLVRRIEEIMSVTLGRKSDIKDKARQQPFIMCMGVPEFPGNVVQ